MITVSRKPVALVALAKAMPTTSNNTARTAMRVRASRKALPVGGSPRPDSIASDTPASRMNSAVDRPLQNCATHTSGAPCVNGTPKWMQNMPNTAKNRAMSMPTSRRVRSVRDEFSSGAQAVIASIGSSVGGSTRIYR